MQAVPIAHSLLVEAAVHAAPTAFSATHVPELVEPYLQVPPAAHMTIPPPEKPQACPMATMGMGAHVLVVDGHQRPSSLLHCGAVFAVLSHASPRPAMGIGSGVGAFAAHFPQVVPELPAQDPLAHCSLNAHSALSASAPVN
jgi:hypothetical protein